MKRSLFTVISCALFITTMHLLADSHSDGRDRFDGWTGLKFDATGYFRLEKTDDRWWFVTPEGNAFLSQGLNHVGPGWVSSDPWRKRLGLVEGHSQNEFLQAMVRRVDSDMKAFGLNTLGAHNQTDWFEQADGPFVPYLKQLYFVNIASWMRSTPDKYVDVFTKEFADFCRQYANDHVAPYREDPYLLGYTLCSVPVLTEMDAERWHGGWVGTYLPTWPRALQNLGAEAPGKKVYVETVKEIYRERIKDFNTTYGTSFSSFDELLKTERWRWREDIVVPQKQQDDDLAFLLKILNRYWKVATEAIRSQDPNHLIWGNKLGANTDISNEVVALSSQYMDLNFMGIYGSYDLHEKVMKRWRQVSEKPFVSGDMDFAVPSKVAPHPTGPHAIDQEERARMFEDFIYRVYAQKDFVGMHWCGWLENPVSRPVNPGVQHTGLFDEHGTPYQPMLEAFSKFRTELYQVHAR